MSSLPLDVHEVLEQEYVALHGDLGPMPGEQYEEQDIVDDAWAQSILRACGIAGGTLEALKKLVADGAEIAKLAKSPQISQSGQKLLAIYLQSAPAEQTPAARRRISDDAFGGAVRSLRDLRLGEVYAKLHAKGDSEARAALCISGGGIRSATFALGIIQGLANAGILSKFHYL